MRTRLSQRQRLGIVLGLNVLMIAGAVIVGFTTHSLSVLAAGGDYVADSVAILLGIIAVAIRDGLGSDAGSEDLHMRSVLLDTLSDALTSAAVAVTGGIIYIAHGLYSLDSIVAIVIALGVGAGAVSLLQDVVLALRAGTALEAPTQAAAQRP